MTVRILDKNGVLCPKADNLVKFSVSGNGTLRAVGSGDQTTLESFGDDQRKAFNGLCMAIVQSTDESGEIMITAKSEGLEKSEIKIRVKSKL